MDITRVYETLISGSNPDEGIPPDKCITGDIQPNQLGGRANEMYRSPVYLACFGNRSTRVRIPPSRLYASVVFNGEHSRLLIYQVWVRILPEAYPSETFSG